MYSPVRDGIEKSIVGVSREEVCSTDDLADFVDNYWEIKSLFPLKEDFVLHAIPDACVNIMFNEIDISISGVTALQTSCVALNLGRAFHYVGIQFLPGVWHARNESLADNFVGDAYTGKLPLSEVNQKMAHLDFQGKQLVMADFVRDLVKANFVQKNQVCASLLANVERIHSVSEMAEVAGLSPRQLQRKLKQWTGFLPHDFLKVIRLQQAMKHGFPVYFADQSHFIHSFHSMTGYTPGRFFKKFDV